MQNIVSRLREIAKIAAVNYKITIDSNSGWQFDDGDLTIGFPSRRGGAILFVKKTGDRYEIVSLKQNDFWNVGIINIFLRSGLAGVLEYLRKLADKGYIFKDNTSPQNLSFPWSEVTFGNSLKDLADASKDFKKLKYYEKVDSAKAFKILTLKEGIQPAVLQSWFPELSQSTDGLTEKIGPFEVSFDHENEKERQQIDDLIKKTITAFEAEGFSKFLYGKIYVVEKIKGRTVADYTPFDDSIRLSHKARKLDSDLRTLIHEIGHRIYAKGGVDLAKIRSKYSEAIQGFSLNIKPGAVIKDKKSGDSFQFTGIDLGSRSKQYKIVKLENGEPNPNKKYKCSDLFFVNFEGDFTIESDWLPTAYSRTNQEEWFCEVLSFALTGNDKFLQFIKSVKN